MNINLSNFGDQNMDTLILTGWGWIDYAAAAALALRACRTADIRGMSTRRLPEYLNSNSARNYKDIYILGIGLTGNSGDLLSALKQLEKKKVHVKWISALELPDGINPEIRSKIDCYINENGLLEAVGSCFGLPGGDIRERLLPKEPTEDSKQYKLLIEAAMFYYRNYQDDNAYGDAIRHIANADPESKWTAAEKQMVEHYKRFGSRELIGKSPEIRQLLERINKIAGHDHARVHIFGESGTGKETVALQIHNQSPRAKEPFLAFNCASVTPNLLESRFFGHEKGAFTGANERNQGLFERANGGTLFLDEIGELPLEAQGILLRVLEGGRFTPMGGKDEIEVDVRLVTATNRDLAAMVRDGKFREDLYYRLNVIQLRVPPLREHKEDIAQIADGYWIKQHRRHLAPEQIEALKLYDYPGNVRELFNILERASVLEITDFTKLIAEHREMSSSLVPHYEPEIPDDFESAARLHVKRVYAKYDGNLTRTSAALGLARNTVKKYLEE